jgi:uncharacterized protein
MAAKKKGKSRPTSARKKLGLPYKLKKSSIQGRGAFATRKIKKGERIVEYKGERISDAEADRRYPTPKPGEHHHTFLFELDDGRVIDASFGGNSARFINHSCDPNCEAIEEDNRIFIQALRDIKPGDELAYDYWFILEEPHTPATKKLYPCRCGSKKCRGTILGKKR